MSSTTRGYLFVTLAAALWGVSGSAAKFLASNKAVPPFLLVQMRMGLSFLILAAALAVLAPALLRIRWRDVPFFATWGIVGVAGVQFTYVLTLSETNVATAIFLQYLAPILTALYAFVFDKQKLGSRLVLCLGLAMGGSFLLLAGGTTRLLVSPLGLAAGLVSAFFLSFYTVYGAKCVGRRSLSPWTVTCYGLGAGAVFWLICDLVLLAMGRPIPGVALLGDGANWLFFAYLAIFATVVPFGLYLIGLRTVSPTQANLTGMLEPVIGSLTAYLVLGETLKPVQLAGGALIVLAVLLLQFRQTRKA
ncbi:MAG TPA: EamA family transporter [Symbiobacteriaceae bacterium]|nr:EamA family transporter [Symbiobacteriaceae bacterium]